MRALVRWWRPLVPIALVVVLAAPLLWRLTTRPPTYPLREVLLDPAQSRNPRITELIPVGREGDAEIFHVQLATADAPALASFDHLRLLMLTHGEGSRLVRASLQIAGTGCRFEAGAGATLAN